jgi:uncharacterized protein (DUF1330 family)
MPAYAIMIRDKMRDADAFAEYGALARAARPAEGMAALAFYGASETLEGPAADGTVILRFDTMAAAKAWYDSPAYAAARQMRHQAADYRVILVEGIE